MKKSDKDWASPKGLSAQGFIAWSFGFIVVVYFICSIYLYQDNKKEVEKNDNDINSFLINQPKGEKVKFLITKGDQSLHYCLRVLENKESFSEVKLNDIKIENFEKSHLMNVCSEEGDKGLIKVEIIK